MAWSSIEWYWVTLVFGATIMPWLVTGPILWMAFARSFIEGITAWLMIALAITPALFLLVWVARSVLGS